MPSQSPFPDLALPPIVLVDDCEDDLFLARHLLREGGVTHPILAFEDPAAARAFLRDALMRAAALPRLLFTDIKMSCAGGLELIAWLRAQRQLDAVRIAVMSGSNRPADVERALEAGADGYLVKFPGADVLAEFVRCGPRVALPHSTMDASAALSA